MREFVRAQLRMWCKSEFSDVAELGVTELLTNVFLHTGGGGELLMRETSDGIRVGVIDFDDRLPLARAAKPDATSGRGLHLLTRLVGELETELLPRGKDGPVQHALCRPRGRGRSKELPAMAAPLGDHPIAQRSECSGMGQEKVS